MRSNTLLICLPAGKWKLRELNREFPRDKEKLKEKNSGSEQSGLT